MTIKTKNEITNIVFLEDEIYLHSLYQKQLNEYQLNLNYFNDINQFLGFIENLEQDKTILIIDSTIQHSMDGYQVANHLKINTNFVIFLISGMDKKDFEGQFILDSFIPKSSLDNIKESIESYI